MEKVYRIGEGAEMIPFDLSAPVVFFPVRHHSPVCSYQMLAAVREYRPEVILIEGPGDANELIPVLTGEGTELPAAIYCYYKDRKKLISADAEDYKCYYPYHTSDSAIITFGYSSPV